MNINWINRAQSLRFDVKNFIDGCHRPISGARQLDKYSPRDGKLLYQLCAGDSPDVDAAVASAKRASEDGRWSKLSVQRRKEVLYKLCTLVEAHREEIALLECLDVGKPIDQALNFDVPTAVTTLRFSAEAADKLYTDVYAADQTSLSFGLCRPVGVVGGIVGWNFPLCLAAQKIGPALATGNCLVLKPSELTSLSAVRIAELAMEAGVPEGVFNVVHGDGGVGAALSRHQEVDLLTFTGSSRTGKELMIAAGRSNMKRLVLECGGKSPNIVFDDCANLEAAAEAIVTSAFWNQGQVCVASSRLMVQENVKDLLLGMILKKSSELIPGDPLSSDTRFGALVSQGHRTKVLEYIESGKRSGAKVVQHVNFVPPHQGGFYESPVIFDEVTSGQAIAQEEIFGPVLSALSFRDEREALQIANSTRYGLSAVVWTTNLGRAHRVSRGIDAGWIVVNGTDKAAGGPAEGVVPVGGLKESGIGVEGGLEGLVAYTKKTAVQFFV